MRWAAGVLLALGLAAVAYASVAIVKSAISARSTGAPAPRAAEGAGSARDPGVTGGAGMRFAAAGPFTIAFAANETNATVAVDLTYRSEIEVRVFGGAASFETAADSAVTINNARSAAAGAGSGAVRYEIDVPRGTPRLEVIVAGRRALLFEKGELVSGPPADSSGRWVITLARRQ
jgi:hypothetical protein